MIKIINVRIVFMFFNLNGFFHKKCIVLKKITLKDILNKYTTFDIGFVCFSRSIVQQLNCSFFL